ncbi:NAD(P)/FAD-dependent oxidoreductase [Angustibacter luteus]|uniref:NAD(P)/FAD-dependent oxidoreductase n=1 Tax=Angustibacter luteus TaxID=658456 RepID=A0ABW1JKG2_9ACTN
MDAPQYVLWQSQLDGGPAATGSRAPLDGDTTADVCIVGAGYTGLWTAYYLTRRDPSLDVLVVEANSAGFGASGRNGGWCSALLPQGVEAMARRHGRPAALAMRQAMVDTVREVGDVVAAEQIDCDFRLGGTVVVARNPAQLARARAEVEHDRAWDGIDGLELLDAGQTREHIGVDGALGATYTPHCARIQPAKLARGLADVVERSGVRIAEGTRATSVSTGEVTTESGRVRARHVLRATEAWTPALHGHRREVVPVYSLIIATEPLPPDFWDTAGLARGETFSEHRHVIVYGQRTADDRLVFGGRGAPYHYGSSIRPHFDQEPAVFAALQSALVDLFPAVEGAEITHRWGGPLGIARDWHASVGYDPASGLGAAGGYVGDGVSTTNLAGRTLADLVTGTESELTRLPWVGHRSRRWEPEPLRWLGVNAGLRLAQMADAEEARTGRPARLGRVLDALTGH